MMSKRRKDNQDKNILLKEIQNKIKERGMKYDKSYIQIGIYSSDSGKIFYIVQSDKPQEKFSFEKDADDDNGLYMLWDELETMMKTKKSPRDVADMVVGFMQTSDNFNFPVTTAHNGKSH